MNGTANLNNPNSGILTAVWGPHLWPALHAITFGYPVEPTEEQKEQYKIFFQSLAHVLPCKYCRESYSYYIISEPTILNLDVLKNRSTLTKWLYDLHNRVNDKLGVKYNVTYDDIINKYESFRAKCIPNSNGCNMPLNLKAESYKNAYQKDCPVISYDLAMAFSNYGKERGVDDFDKLKLCNDYKQIKKCPEWEKRNEECLNIVKEMKLNAIPILEKEGKYKDLPTVHELKLIARLSSNLCSWELVKIANKLGHCFITFQDL
jgi:hypothetical protein